MMTAVLYRFVLSLTRQKLWAVHYPHVWRWMLVNGCWLYFLVLFVGCSKPADNQPNPQNLEPGTQPSTFHLQSATPVVRLHWLGKKRLAAEGNATNFLAIWNMPESAKLEAQTLDKLATAPWRLLNPPTPLAQAPITLLRSLLDDLVQAESYLEVHGATNQPGEMVFAIRLDAARAALWQTNLPIVFKSLVPTQTPDSTFNIEHSKFNIGCSRFGDWILLAWSDSGLKTKDSRLLADFLERIKRNGAPFPAQATNYWFEAQVEAPRLSDVANLGWKLPASFPQIYLSLMGDGQNVRTRGELNFDQSLPALETWRVPLNLTGEPLTGLTVVRSVPPVLERLGLLSPEQAESFPAQFLLWLRSGPPLQIYFACPTPDATNAFWKLAPPIRDWVNSHTDACLYGSISLDTSASELIWSGLSLCSPFLKTGTNSEIQYLHGGFGLMPPGKLRLPTELHDHITQASNLVYFDWEFTAEALQNWRYLDDVSRMIFDAAHASRLRTGRQSIQWILTNTTNLSHSVTEIHQSNSNQLVLTRKSTLGLNAVELDILFNWIEMPDFPRGMSTLWRTNPAPFVPFRPANAPAAPTR